MHRFWIEDHSTFAAREGDWDRLFDGAAKRNVFLSHAWIDAAWAWAEREVRPTVLMVEAGDGATLAAPLALRTQSLGGLPWRTLEWLDVPDTQDCDLLVREDRHAGAGTDFVAALVEHRNAWDKLRLRRIRDDSHAMSSVRAALEARELRVLSRQSETNLFVPLDGGWPAYQSGLTRSFKKKLNLARNRLAKLGEVHIERICGAEHGTARIAEAGQMLVEVSARSWKQGTDTTLDREGPRDFFARLLARFGRGEQLVIWVLRLDGRPVATELQLREDRTTYALRSDFDPELHEASPGTNLSMELLKRLFETDAGGRYLMGPGTNAYKLRWTEQGLPLHELTAYSPTPRGLALYALEQKIRPWARDLRDRLRKPEKRSEEQLAAAEED